MKNYTLLILMLLIGNFVYSQTNASVKKEVFCSNLQHISPIRVDNLELDAKRNFDFIGRMEANYNYCERKIFISNKISYYIDDGCKTKIRFYPPCFRYPTKNRSIKELHGTPADFAYSPREGIANQLLMPIKASPFH